MPVLTAASWRLAARIGAGAVIAIAVLMTGWGETLFAAHMGQHLLLIAIAAPLLVLGGVEIRVPPLAGWAAFILVFLFWHWPTAFQWAAERPATEALELGTILLAALCFWSGALGVMNDLNDGARALLVMTAAILTDLPGVVMLFAPTVICTMPRENAAAFGLTALQDQQIGGLLMWVPANLVFFGIATLLFARWISEKPASGADYAPRWR